MVLLFVVLTLCIITLEQAYYIKASGCKDILWLMINHFFIKTIENANLN